MEKSFNIEISEDDYVRVGRMQVAPVSRSFFGAKQVAFLVLLAAVLGPAVFFRRGSMSALPFGPPGLFAGILFMLSVLHPARLRALYAQQTELHEPLTIRFNEETIHGSNDLGGFGRSWSGVVKWMGADEYLVLFIDDVRALVLPRSQVEDAILEEIEKSLRAAGVPLTQPSNIYAVLSLLLALWNAFLIAMEAGLVGPLG